MTLNDALDIFKKQNPKRKVTGYWGDGDNIILNIKPTRPIGAPEPCQFMIEASGKTYWTIPIRHDAIKAETMKKL